MTERSQGTMAPDNFHLFPDLPPEIQDIIWQQCIPRRVITPWYTSDSQERLGMLPGTRHETDLPVHALVPFRPPLISRVCKAARATVLRCGQYTPVVVENEDGSIHDGSIWLNKKSDWVYFNYFAMIHGLDVSDAPPQVFELARDATVPLLIATEIQSDHELRLQNSSQEEETVGSRLYKSFLSGREHFYFLMAHFDLVVSGKGRERVVETGLFGLLGEDTAIVPTSNKEMLQQYILLYNTYDTREAYNPCVVGPLHRLDSLIKGEDPGVYYQHEPRFILSGILERICKERGESDVSGEDMLKEDGSLKSDHPLVERLGITMPTYETVVIFELRRLDTLLEDSAARLSWDSTDSTDEGETTDTIGMESDES